jgi:hypothetical protein
MKQLTIKTIFKILSRDKWSVFWWSEFLATGRDSRVPFPALPDFLISRGSTQLYAPAALYSPETSLFLCLWYSFLLEAE